MRRRSGEAMEGIDFGNAPGAINSAEAFVCEIYLYS